MYNQIISLIAAAMLCNAPASLPGDVNDDHEVNIADVNAIVDIILDGHGAPTTADVNQDHEVNIADVNAVIDIILGGTTSAPDDHEWVDLGLPSGTLWATCNVGADNPEDYGYYLAWGETKPKETYTWENYKWCDGSKNWLTKYCTESDYGTVDGKIELDREDDAAFVNWGPAWRMPTVEQIYELRRYTSSTRTVRNGVKGRLITGRNGNSIFLPGTGDWPNGGGAGGYAGDYWSRGREEEYSTSRMAFGLGIDSGVSSWGYFIGFRCDGYTVRPVRESPADYIEQNSLDLDAVPMGETCTGELTLTNSTDHPMTFTFSTQEPFSLEQQGNASPSISVVVQPGSRSAVTVMFTSTAIGETDGNVTIQSPSMSGVRSVIPVNAFVFNADCLQQEYVDLGLTSGTLWATTNVGARNPEDYGDYFAWGETAPKENYTWYTYKWCDNGNDHAMTKYCTDSYYGTVDGKTGLDPDDDAAQVNCGPAWRMPTPEQQKELLFECVWTWTSLNGVEGSFITGPNGNSIFLPAAGYRSDDSLYNAGSYCGFWARIGCNNDAQIAGYMFLNTGLGERYLGHSVRAVRISRDE